MVASTRRRFPHVILLAAAAIFAAAPPSPAPILAVPPPPSVEAALLLAFKSAVERDPLHILATWSATPALSPCLWTGITCSSDGFVVSLALPKAELEAELASPPIAAALGGLRYLRHLNLHHNKLRGPIPASLFNATQLQSLFLFSNLLSGEIPAEISRLDALQSFSVAHNSLSGPLPPLFSPSLRYLDLSHNAFQGPIPAAAVSDDLSLDLSFNNLSGAIPPSFAHLSSSAFTGNPYLCGAPLTANCSGAAATSPPPHSAAKLSRRAVAIIAAADAVALLVIGLAFLCFCVTWRRRSTVPGVDVVKPAPPLPPKQAARSSTTTSSPAGGEDGNTEAEKKAGGAAAMLGGELVVLGEGGLGYNMEELLKASAYVMGKGGKGIVYRVRVSEEVTVAVRRLGDRGGQRRYGEFRQAVHAIAALRHPNVVALRAYYWAPDEKLLVYDFIPNATLAAAIRGGHSQLPYLQPFTRLKIARGAARGLAFLHSHASAAHGDVRATNVLLDHDMEAYIADYGLSNLVKIVGSGVPNLNMKTTESDADTGKKLSSSSRSSAAASEDSEASDAAPPAPARKSGRKASSAAVYPPPSTEDQKSDVYGFGMILLELVLAGGGERGEGEAAAAPWLVEGGGGGGGNAAREVAEEALGGGRVKGVLEEVLKVAQACLAASPDMRPTMGQVSRSLDAIMRT